MVRSSGIHAIVATRVKILRALVHVAASALVVLQLESFGATATSLVTVLLIRVRAIAIARRPTGF